jgi:DNA repair protein RecO (recombination protein O)
MERTVNAIVLRRRDSGESDRRLTLLTEEHGKLEAVAKGARKAASRLAGISDPLSVAIMTLAEGKRNRFVTQAQPLSSFRGLRTDFERLSFALALVELYAATIPHEQPFPEAHALLVQSLKALETHDKPLVALVWAEVQLLAISGFMPQLEECVITGERVSTAEPFLSPRAGGFVCEVAAIPFTDRFRTRAEVLFGLIQLAQIEEPPRNLKFADESLVALLPFWRAIAEAPLPANESAVAEVRHG